MEGKEIKEKRRSPQYFDEAFKRKVCDEYIRTGVAKTDLLSKYNIRYRSAIQSWLKELGYVDIYQKVPYLSIATPLLLPLKKPNNDQPSGALSQEQQRIKELERLLEDEQLRSEMYKRMIEIAERDLNIPIRKKSDTK
jgi:transposase